MPNRLAAPPPRRGRLPIKAVTATGQVQSLTRGLSLLEALARAESGLSLTDSGAMYEMISDTVVFGSSSLPP